MVTKWFLHKERRKVLQGKDCPPAALLASTPPPKVQVGLPPVWQESQLFEPLER